jgi:hypothetical protein
MCGCKDFGVRNYHPHEHASVWMQRVSFFTNISARFVCSSFVCPCWRMFNAQDGCTALISAAGEGHIECVRLLIEAGANKEAKDKVRVNRVFHFAIICRVAIFRLQDGFRVLYSCSICVDLII